MGYFAYAYVVEGTADEDGVTVSTSVYANHIDGKAFFSWAGGQRSPGLHSYAAGTLYSDAKLSLLPGYPRTDRLGTRPGESPDLVLIEESFIPRDEAEPVLFHFVLPPGFVPRPNMLPLVVPSPASVALRGDALTASIVARGGGDVRFWLARLDKDARLEEYNLDRIFDAPSSTAAKVTFEINLGVLKVSLSNR